MATLSTTDQASLQSAIDLMLKGTARETPFAEDVIERLNLIAKSQGMPTGILPEVIRDTPISTLIELLYMSGSAVLTQAQQTAILSAVDLMIAGQAYETPFSEDVIERLAPVASSTGFLTRGGFYEAVKDRPVSTMLQWALFLGKK